MSKILYGIRIDNGKVANINEVPTGLECNCLCPQCNMKLIAKKGNERMHHFAHYEEQNRECNADKANESALHKMAKEIVLEERTFGIPPLKVMKKDLTLGLPQEIYVHLPDSYTHIKSQKITFDNVELEKQYFEFQPDIVGTKVNGKIFIEIAVTHYVDELKKAAVEKEGISMIEVDLSQFIDIPVSKEKLKNTLLDSNELKKWIYHRKYNEAKLKAYDYFQNHEITVKYNEKKRKEEDNKRIKEEKKRKKEEAEKIRLEEVKNQDKNKRLKTVVDLLESGIDWMIAENMINNEIYEFKYKALQGKYRGKGIWGRKSKGKIVQNGKERYEFYEEVYPVKYWNEPVWSIVRRKYRETKQEESADNILKEIINSDKYRVVNERSVDLSRKNDASVDNRTVVSIKQAKRISEILEESNGKRRIYVKNTLNGDIFGLDLMRDFWGCKINFVYSYKEEDGKLVEIANKNHDSLRSNEPIWEIYLS